MSRQWSAYSMPRTSRARARSSSPAPRIPANKTLELLEDETDTTIIDLTGAAEERPEARFRAPLVESSEDGEEGEFDSAGAGDRAPRSHRDGAVSAPAALHRARARLGDPDFRPRQRAWHGGRGRTARADRQSAVVQEASAKCLRHTTELHHAGEIRGGSAEVAAGRDRIANRTSPGQPARAAR